ncbi:MAG: glycosyltransferase family 9 protein [Fimbriimonas sp.]
MSAPRFLLVRFSAIGDCVMAAWAATAIRRKYPDGFLLWAVESRCAAVVDRKQLVTQACEFPRDRWKRKRWSPATWREQVALYSRLRALKFDCGIDLQGHSKTALCLRLAKPKRRIATRATDSLARKLNPVYGAKPAGVHTVEWNHEVLCTFGDFELPVHPLMPLRDEPWEAARGHLGAGRIASISVSAGQPDKAYASDRWREVAASLVRDGFQVVFLGGPTDSPIDAPGTVDLVRKLPLDQTMAVVAHSAIHLAGDTGTGHMAAAYGVPLVSVFGPTDPAVFRPYSDLAVVLREGRDTSNVPAERVIEAARELDRRVRAGLPH